MSTTEHNVLNILCTKVSDKMAYAKRAYLDQTAAEGESIALVKALFSIQKY